MGTITPEFLAKWARVTQQPAVPQKYIDWAIAEKTEAGESLEFTEYPGGAPTMKGSLKIKAVYDRAYELYRVANN